VGVGLCQPNGPAVCSRTTRRTGIAARTGLIEPSRKTLSDHHDDHVGAGCVGHGAETTADFRHFGIARDGH
jgi:hypothetical protein